MRDKTLNLLLVGIALAVLLCVIVLIAAKTQRVEHQDIIAHCDDVLYKYGG